MTQNKSTTKHRSLLPEGATLKEVAAELGVSHQYAERLEKKALRKLRAFCDEHGITVEDLRG